MITPSNEEVGEFDIAVDPGCSTQGCTEPVFDNAKRSLYTAAR